VASGAAASTSDWIYEPEAKQAAIKGQESTPEFVSASASPFYAVPMGAQSMFGHELLQVIGHVSTAGGVFD